MLKKLFESIKNIFSIEKKYSIKNIIYIIPFFRRKKEEEENLKESLKTVFYAFMLAMAIRSFFFEPFHIPSSSMKPNLLIGDFIFVSKFTYGYSKYSFPLGLPIFNGRTVGAKPKRGDVIVFRLPQNPKINYIKRLIGLPNDEIQIKRGVVYINGNKIPKEYISNYSDLTVKSGKKYLETLPNNKKFEVLDTEQNGIGDDTFVYKVPKKHYFFLGDNRDNSLDSRFTDGAGYVPEENLVGKAQIIFLSSKENPLKFWTWFSSIRLSRMFKRIK
jgi:signal peptidase I